MSDETVTASVIPLPQGGQYIAPSYDTLQEVAFQFVAATGGVTPVSTQKRRINSPFNRIFISPSARGYAVIVSFSAIKQVSDGLGNISYTGQFFVSATDSTQVFDIPTRQGAEIEVALQGVLAQGGDIVVIGVAYVPDSRERFLDEL